jgi:FkbM family methyltransferase
MLKDLLASDGFNQLVRGRNGTVLFNKNDTVVGRSVRYYGEYFESEVDIFKQIVQPGWHVADIGANIGTHAQSLAGIVGPSGWVYAFEAQRLVFQTLCANIANNSIANVDCERLAIDERDGEILVEDVDPRQAVNYGGISLGHSRANRRVKSVALDHYLNGRPLHFMKVDVEGLELACLRGAKRTLANWNTVIYIENDRPANSPLLLKYLDEAGYDAYWHLPLFYNAGNFAGEAENIHGISYIDTGAEFLETIGFAINMLCIPRSFSANICLMKVEDIYEHPMIKGGSRFHPGQ